jgi:hypothetical protein
MSGLAADAGFDVAPTCSPVEDGISPEFAVALKAEAKRRAEANAFFGCMALCQHGRAETNRPGAAE